jgi:hypothetical protein
MDFRPGDWIGLFREREKMISPPYPDAFPIDAAKVLITKLRGGDVPIPSAIHAAWVMSGYALNVTLPAPQVVGDLAMTDAIAADYLQTQVDPPIVLGSLALPWKLLASFLVKKMVEWIIENQMKG